MKPMPSIEAFRHVVRNVKDYCNKHNKPLPTLKYLGTCKLHGTSAAVRVTSNKVQPQKRTAIIDIGNDNAGFAMFCHGKDAAFRNIVTSFTDSQDFTLFGEWCGGNIQKGVAVTQLEKHFVIFGGYDALTENFLHINAITANLDATTSIEYLNSIGIWFINQIPLEEITIDFSKPEDMLAKLDELTLAVEKECPWGKFRGVTGCGEGLVWICADYPILTNLWFKTKGLEHKRTNISTGTKTEASPERLATIREIVDRVLPEWRLEQGITFLKENGLEIIPENTGKYLQWISKDILKEDSDILAENQLEWKHAVKYITPQARQYYMKEIDKLAFGDGDGKE